MLKPRILLCLLTITVLFVACSSQVVIIANFNSFDKIQVGGGPEDFHPDTIVGQRLLLSCESRRGEDKQGSIWAHDFDTEIASEIPFKPVLDFDFHPHGIHLISEEDKTYLFVINHRDKKNSEIDRFVVYSDHLELDHRFVNIVGSPNDLFAVTPDEFYYSDYKVFGGSIVHYNGNYTKVVKYKAMPNGLIVENGILYFSTTISGKLYRTELSSNKTRKLAKAKGGDNIMNYSSNEILLATHPSFFKFIKHAVNGDKLAPTLVYCINKKTGERTIFYKEEGNVISAASTAYYFRNRLYLGQIFEPFIVVAEE